jgi:putative tryptophan/tyrosine transport system substrate-binding protein
MDPVHRRQFLGAAGGLLAASITKSQPSPRAPGKRRVGVLDFNSERIGLRDSIRIHLKERGWVEGENIAFEHVFDHDSRDFRGLAEGLVREAVDLIVAIGPREALAAATATREIPILFLNVQFPVEQGLVASHARPGRNVTGVAAASGMELLVKRLEILKEIAPAATRLAWIRESSRVPGTRAGGSMDLAAQESAVRQLGYRMRIFEPSGDFVATAREVVAWRAQALTLSNVAWGTVTRAIEFALRHRLPSAASNSQFAIDGGLVSFHVDADELPKLAAQYIDHILRGARPAGLPVAMPGRYHLHVNLKTARAIGVTVPQSIVLRADQVIDR